MGGGEVKAHLHWTNYLFFFTSAPSSAWCSHFVTKAKDNVDLWSTHLLALVQDTIPGYEIYTGDVVCHLRIYLRIRNSLTFIVSRGASRILRRRGRQPPGTGRQPMILPNFLINCMKLRKFWTVEGGDGEGVARRERPPLRSATGLWNITYHGRSRNNPRWSKLLTDSSHIGCKACFHSANSVIDILIRLCPIPLKSVLL